MVSTQHGQVGRGAALDNVTLSGGVSGGVIPKLSIDLSA
jgi:hypothetical protein